MMNAAQSHIRRGRHAVVLGGSMAGLCAARVLSERFDRVTLVERDRLDDRAVARKGVPQGRHLHALLRGGQELLARWFPDLDDALLAGGAVPMEMGTDFVWFHFGAWKAPVASGVRAVALTRPFLEAEVRRRVRAIGNVRVLDGHDVTGLTSDAGARRVTGARVRARDDEGAPEVTLDADLVVDATGRGSRTPKWLEALGRGATPVSTVKVDVGYSSRAYALPPPGTVPWKACYVLGQSPESRRLGIVMQVEGGLWMTVLAGLLGDHPPDDDAGYLEYARSLPDPSVWNALRHATPVDDIATYRFPAHVRHHYERVRDMPDGLAVLGDAHLSFNPIYGQGMTCAAIGADVLARTLDASRDGLVGASKAFQRALARELEMPWRMSTGEDLRYPEVEGERPAGDAAMQWITARMHRAASRDPEVARAFYAVMHMVAPPTALLRPDFVRRVLGSAGRAGPAPDAPLVAAREA
jgi:2-polyprenyl-6-methoxyphenol hydroxylase-like FAD-dependent oxidoreductase